MLSTGWYHPSLTRHHIVITGGMCPGPSIVSFGAMVKASGVFLPYMVAGIAAKEAFFGH
jgi:hypothetical protein